ncbi:MAG: zinc-ribbon domain-containing protein [Desulfobulbaceae bacterium]|nr:zinc-ribbon domain-containing protein [Desulfobulbaceae bacterium]
MLIICEDCAKRYNIDESRIKGSRARFTCRECGHIIIVDKSDLTRSLISSSAPSRIPESHAASIDPAEGIESIFGDTQVERPEGIAAAKSRNRGLPLNYYLLPVLLAAFLCTSGVLAYLYTAYLAENLQRSGMSADFLIKSLLLLGLSWGLALLIYLAVARSLVKTLTGLKENAVRQLRGEHVAISPRGPREVRELANVLQKIVHRGHP